MKRIISFLLLILFVLIFYNENSFAIPSFARKYNMSCQTCHSPFPKLKAYGDEFAGNGFVLADKEAPRYYVETGDPELSLIRDLPLALRMEAFVTYNNKNSEQSDFTTPYNLKFLSGGAIAKDIAYYFYFFFSERGEVSGVEDAFLMFNNLFGSELDLYVGQFQISDPLFKRELRLTFEDYQIYKTNVGYSNANLTYDRGIMLTYGFETGTDIILEVVNGSGIGSANILRNFDNDKYKNVLGRVSQDVSDFLRVGAFGYFGKERLEDIFSNTFTNSFTLFGPDLTLSLEDKLELNLQYVQRKDTRPTLFSNDIKSKGAFGELIFTPQGDESKLYAAALYNWVNSDFDSADYESLTFNVGYMLRRNIRLIGEFTYNTKREFGQAAVGIISAF